MFIEGVVMDVEVRGVRSPLPTRLRAVVDDTEVIVESPHQKVGERAVTGCRSQWTNQLVDMFAKVLVVTPKSMAGDPEK